MIQLLQTLFLALNILLLGICVFQLSKETEWNSRQTASLFVVTSIFWAIYINYILL